MLRLYLSVAHGLVNGAVGIIHDIVHEEIKSPSNDHPFCILVQFPEYRGVSCVDDVEGVVPIFPHHAKFLVGSTEYPRHQFPSSVA